MRELKQSPMNYTGNKFKLLPQLLPLFPQDINTFYDVCCGGLAVSLNTKATKYICNDIDFHIIDLYKAMQASDTFVEDVCSVLQDYGLDDASVDDPESYMRLRSDYNESRDSVLFFAVLVLSFNSILLYNMQGDCSSAYGHGKGGNNPGLSPTRKINLENLIHWMRTSDVTFTQGRFSDVCIADNSFVYIDPPYLITLAAYNKKGWNNVDEYQMYSWLDALTERGIKWGMSNVTRNRGTIHVKLKRWATKYNVIEIEHKYRSLAKAGGKPKDGETQEVYICNY